MSPLFGIYKNNYILRADRSYIKLYAYAISKNLTGYSIRRISSY